MVVRYDIKNNYVLSCTLSKNGTENPAITPPPLTLRMHSRLKFLLSLISPSLTVSVHIRVHKPLQTVAIVTNAFVAFLTFALKNARESAEVVCTCGICQHEIANHWPISIHLTYMAT